MVEVEAILMREIKRRGIILKLFVSTERRMVTLPLSVMRRKT